MIVCWFWASCCSAARSAGSVRGCRCRGKQVEADARLSDPVLPNDVIFVRESLF